MASSSGMAVLISLVRLTSWSDMGRVPTFLGVAGLALMTDCAHDVSLMALIVDGVAHRFSINGQTFVLLTIGLVPAL